MRFLLRHVQVGDRALEHLGRHADRSRDSVGCGWMVRPMSSASAPISIASATSAIRSPAFVPTMPPPTMRCVASSNSSLVKPSSRPSAERAAGRGPRELALAVLDALAPWPRSRSGRPRRPRDRCRRPTGSPWRRRTLFWPAATSAATLPSCIALCASIGWPTMSPMAKMCGTLVRICLSTGMKPRSSTATPAFSAPIALAVRPRARPRPARGRSVSVAGALAALEAAPRGRPARPRPWSPWSSGGSPRSASRSASCSGVTRSWSAPGMSWSISSTTVTFAPSAS